MSIAILQIGVVLEIQVPISLMEKLQVYAQSFKDEPSWSLERLMHFSIGVGSPGENQEGAPKWNRGINGVASAADRLKSIRRLLRKGQTRLVRIPISLATWQAVESCARRRGISDEEHCLVALAYHAALPEVSAQQEAMKAIRCSLREQKKATVPSPLSRFEKALKADAEGTPDVYDEDFKRPGTSKGKREVIR